MPNKHLRELGAARADQAVDAEDLAAPQRERDVLEFAGAAQVLDAQQSAPGVGLELRKQLVDRPADHEPDQFVAVTSPSSARADRTAVAKHRVAVGEPKISSNLWLMNSSAQPGIAQLAHDAEQLRAFALRQRRGRLVEDEHARFVDQRARDLHHVLLRDAQAARRHVGVEVRVEIAQHRGRARAHRAPVHEPAARRLRIDEQVFGDERLSNTRHSW